LQIRANWESGIAPEEQTEFFTNTLFKAMAEAGRPFIFDFRCWLAEPKTVENALNMVPGTRLSCKYWAEFLGAPYQPAKIVPGYSYSDFLKHPMRTDLIYQLWNLGSPRLLLWGDPEYVRRFVHSLKLGGGAGFEMNTHLAQKGYGNDAGYWRVFRHEEDEYFTYEYERYWMTGLLFGRLSYNPDSPRDIWMRALRLRFGAAAEEVMNLYEAGSGIITFLIQYQLSDYNMYIWPEIDTGGLLDFYMQTPGSDKCVVDIVENYVDGITKDDPSGLFSPLESSEHFRLMAEKTLLAAAGLEKLPNPSKELASTIKDFKILSFLGLYHSVKTLAAVSLKYYYAAGDITCLRDAYEKIRKATVYWEQLISLGRDYYYDKMVTGPNDAGSWRTKLELVYEDEIRVAELIRVAERYGGSCFAVDFGPVSDKPSPFRTWLNFDILHSYVVEKGFSQADAGTVYSAERGYGWESGTIHDVSMPLVRLNDLEFDAYRRDTWDSAPVEQCKGLRSALNEDGVWGTSPAVFRCDLENGEYEVSVIIADQTEHTRIHGPMTLEAGDIKISEFMAMPVDETIKTVRVKITEGFLRINIACVSGGDWFLSGIAVKPLAPLIRVVPVVVLTREHPVVSATIHSPEGIQKAELSIDGGTPVPLKLRQGCEYSADLGDLPPFGKKIRTPCIITAESSGGKRSRRESILLLRDKASEIRVTHTPVNTGKAGKDIPIKAIISSAYPLRKALLHYSYVNQFEEIHTVDLKAAKNEYTAIIPGTYIDPQWDLLYYFELVDELGSGIIYPDMRTRTPYWVIEPLR
jgi:hypothetical protein